jgi:hypothetical protein
MKFRQAIETASVVARNLILGGNLISLSLAKRPRYLLTYVSETLFLYKTFNDKREIPQRNVFEVLPANNIENIRLGNLELGGTWFLPLSEYTTDIVSLCLVCQIIKPHIVFEIGTLTGYTAFHFALNSPDDARVYTLDLPIDEKVTPKLKTTVTDDAHIHLEHGRYCFENTPVAENITCLFGDSATFNFSPFHNRVDFFFVDGAHSYEYVRSDTLNALNCCHPGSVIAWHDFGRLGLNGVSKWVLELSREHKIYSVPGSSLAFMIV